jgi:hypothetical protein
VVSTDKSAAFAFEQLAKVAERQPFDDSGTIHKTVRDAWFLSTDPATGKSSAASVLVPTVVEQFSFPNARVRVIERRGSPLDSNGQVTNKQGNWSDDPALSDDSFRSTKTEAGYPATLPTDPDALVTQLIEDETQCAGIRAFCLSTALTQLHFKYAVPPAQTAALWRVLADEPTISWLGKSRDRLDREAVAFSLPGADTSRRILLFADPDTGDLLGSEEVLIEDSAELGLDAPAVVEFTALVEARLVNDVDVPAKER